MTFKEYRTLISAKEIDVSNYIKNHAQNAILISNSKYLLKSIKKANTVLRWMTALQFVSLSVAFGSFQQKQYWPIPFALLIPYLFFGLFLINDYSRLKKQDTGTLMKLLESINGIKNL